MNGYEDISAPSRTWNMHDVRQGNGGRRPYDLRRVPKETTGCKASGTDSGWDLHQVREASCKRGWEVLSSVS